MYIMKIKGTAKIPDYVQIRDSQFTLVGYFRADRPEKGLKKLGFDQEIENVKSLIDELPFGQMRELNIDIQ